MITIKLPAENQISRDVKIAALTKVGATIDGDIVTLTAEQKSKLSATFYNVHKQLFATVTTAQKSIFGRQQNMLCKYCKSFCFGDCRA